MFVQQGAVHGAPSDRVSHSAARDRGLLSLRVRASLGSAAQDQQRRTEAKGANGKDPNGRHNRGRNRGNDAGEEEERNECVPHLAGGGSHEDLLSIGGFRLNTQRLSAAARRGLKPLGPRDGQGF